MLIYFSTVADTTNFQQNTCDKHLTGSTQKGRFCRENSCKLNDRGLMLCFLNRTRQPLKEPFFFTFVPTNERQIIAVLWQRSAGNSCGVGNPLVQHYDWYQLCNKVMKRFSKVIIVFCDLCTSNNSKLNFLIATKAHTIFANLSRT